MRLARVGHDGVVGYLDGGVASWHDAGFEVASVPQITVMDLHELLKADNDLQVVDVRRPGEYASGHVPGARALALSDLQKSISRLDFDPTRRTAVICAGGYRSSAAASILEQHEFTDLLNVVGGTGAWVAAGYDVEGA